MKPAPLEYPDSNHGKPNTRLHQALAEDRAQEAAGAASIASGLNTLGLKLDTLNGHAAELVKAAKRNTTGFGDLSNELLTGWDHEVLHRCEEVERFFLEKPAAWDLSGFMNQEHIQKFTGEVDRLERRRARRLWSQIVSKLDETDEEKRKHEVAHRVRQLALFRLLALAPQPDDATIDDGRWSTGGHPAEAF